MDFLDSIEAEWQDAVARWESTVADFQTALDLHIANKSKAEALGPDEYARWLDQLDYANRVKTAIEMLQESLSATSEWARTTFGLGSLRRMGSQMGALPLIPVAVIVGSISTVTAVIYALYSYNSELERKWQYIQQNPNITPEQVKAVLESSAPIPVLGSAGSMAFWIVLGGLALYFGPMLFRRQRR